jgi:hypothetical protein
VIGKIISGGQTGVDRGALDVALDLGIPCGGWCPKGRRSEDGKVPERYPLKETAATDYRVRTEKNVRESDATDVLTWGAPTGGTGYTVKVARQFGKQCKIVDLSEPEDPQAGRDWAKESQHPRPKRGGTEGGEDSGDPRSSRGVSPRGRRAGVTDEDGYDKGR